MATEMVTVMEMATATVTVKPAPETATGRPPRGTETETEMEMETETQSETATGQACPTARHRPIPIDRCPTFGASRRAPTQPASLLNAVFIIW